MRALHPETLPTAWRLLGDGTPEDEVAVEVGLDLRELRRQLGRRVEPASLLTPRRLEALQLAARGLSNASIAAATGVTAVTVRKRLADLRAELDVDTTADAIAVARERGLIE